MTLVWDHDKLRQDIYGILDNIDQAQNSYDQEKPSSKNIHKRGAGDALCLLHPSGICLHLQLLSVPEVLEHCGLHINNPMTLG
jgi:hypothetical protein